MEANSLDSEFAEIPERITTVRIPFLRCSEDDVLDTTWKRLASEMSQELSEIQPSMAYGASRGSDPIDWMSIMPAQLIRQILMKTVLAELVDCRLAKCAWQSVARASIGRLSDTCSRWSEILETNIFQTRLYNAMNNMAEPVVKLDFVCEVQLACRPTKIFTMGSEILMVVEGLGGGQYLTRYPSGQLITFPGLEIEENLFVEPCCPMNCFYLGTKHVVNGNVTIWKVYKGVEDKFTAVKWCIIGNVGMCKASATNEGCLLIYWRNIRSWEYVVRLFDANGMMVHSSTEPEEGWFLEQRMMLRNGNVLNLYEQIINNKKLQECSVNGDFIREYRFNSLITECIMDRHERIIAFNHHGGMECLDSEWNALESSLSNAYTLKLNRLRSVQYDHSTHQIFCLADVDAEDVNLIIFKLSN